MNFKPFRFSNGLSGRLLSRVTFSLPLLFVLFLLIHGLSSRFLSKKQDEVRLQLGAPVLSLNPVKYDDWSSVFIGNHIYPRLLMDEERPWLPYLAQELKISCVESRDRVNEIDCRKFEIRFRIRPTFDCLGRSYTPSNFRDELKSILEKKNWIFPKWEFCSKAGDDVCILASDVSDVRRRMQNIYFRFGWSVFSKTDKLIGMGPYCLGELPEPGNYEAGLLKPMKDYGGNPQFPPIRFFNSVSPETEFSVALYGSSELLRGERKNVRAHTPLAYYLISDPRWATVATPWNEPVTREIIQKYLLDAGLVYQGDSSAFEKLVPLGSAGDSKTLSQFTLDDPAIVFLPDYIESCPRLEEELRREWKKYSKLKFECADISAKIQEYIYGGKKGFGAVLTPLSPGAPGRDAIQAQYFSSFSKESFTGSFRKPEFLYRLVGMGDSVVTLDGQRFCGLKAQSLGLSDIFVSDFLPCE